MEQSPASILAAQPDIAHQQAIVDLLDTKVKKPTKRVIPGGVNMLKVLDQTKLTEAVYTWLRGKREFTEVTISMAKDPNKFSLMQRKIQDFPTNTSKPIWKTKGLKALAESLASAMKKEKFVTISAKQDGIYLTVDSQNKFGPTRKLTKSDISAMTKALPEGKTLQFKEGDLVQSEDWAPYIEFI